jgi:16S rRNA G966 N2-methylase RsmD
MTDETLTKLWSEHLVSTGKVHKHLINEYIDETKVRQTIIGRQEAAKKMAANGMTQRQIATQLGTSLGTINRDLSQNGTKSVPKLNAEKRRDDFDKPVANLPEGLVVGDFREQSPKTLAVSSVDLVFTDPPYDEKSIPLYEAAALEARRVLKPGGFMICYCGHTILPAVLPRMMAYLKYFWIGAHVHDGGHSSRIIYYGIAPGFKPLLWFVKDYRADRQEFITDTILAPQEKDFHEWQQSIKTAEYFIEKLVSKDGLVVDFFAGGGSTMLAARNVGRKCLAFEIDNKAIAAITERLAE